MYYVNKNAIAYNNMPDFFSLPEYPDYGFSIDGRILSFKTNRLISGCPNYQGYQVLCLRNYQGVKKNPFYHRLYAELFLPLPERFRGDYSLATINHKDHNKQNNSLENLEWVTLSENVKEAWDSGYCDSTIKSVQLMDINTGQVYSFRSCADAIRELNLYDGSINSYLNKGRRGIFLNKYLVGFSDDPEWINVLANKKEAVLRALSLNNTFNPIIATNIYTGEKFKFRNVVEASNFLQLNASSIKARLNGRIKNPVFNGYTFERENIVLDYNS